LRWKQGATHRREDVLDLLGHLAAQQPSSIERLHGHGVDDAFPLRIAQVLEFDRHLVRLWAAALDDGFHTLGAHVE
jgi:hypothetical protein